MKESPDTQNISEGPLTLSSEQKQDLLQRYRNSGDVRGLAYGTVEDFCDSSDHVPFLTDIQGDLKDLQRPAALKLILALLPPNSSLLEVGAGEPYVANALSELGYNVAVVDPYDGSGRGPTEFEYYVRKYPNIKIIRGLFSESLSEIEPHTLDCVYSISVLEHVHQPGLADVFAGIRRFLRSGGYSLHLIDHVLSGEGQEFHEDHLADIVSLQGALDGTAPSKAIGQFFRLLNRAAQDVDTYYLSAEGHNKWRGTAAYSAFRFRKVISITSCGQHTFPSDPPPES
jgi:SAM-dependent methyltransferase